MIISDKMHMIYGIAEVEDLAVGWAVKVICKGWSLLGCYAMWLM
jgi:hypothetical protein